MTVVLLSAFSIIGLRAIVDQSLWSFTGKDLDTVIDIVLLKYKWAYIPLKPIISCELCMSSVWGTIFYFIWSFLFGGGILGWLPSLIAIAGVITVLNRLRG